EGKILSIPRCKSVSDWNRQYELQRNSIIPTLFRRSVKLLKENQNNTPGVGTYGIKGDPYLYKEIMDAKHKSSSIRGILECRGETNRFLPPTTSENPEPETSTLKSFTSDLLRLEKQHTGKFRKLVDEQRKVDRSYSSRMKNNLIAYRSPVGPGRYNSENYDQSRCIWGAMCSFDCTSSARLSLRDATKLR
ncbi:hypothetical protein MN116_008855, partial [Schistosoma mekongi]